MELKIAANFKRIDVKLGAFEKAKRSYRAIYDVIRYGVSQGRTNVPSGHRLAWNETGFKFNSLHVALYDALKLYKTNLGDYYHYAKMIHLGIGCARHHHQEDFNPEGKRPNHHREWCFVLSK